MTSTATSLVIPTASVVVSAVTAVILILAVIVNTALIISIVRSPRLHSVSNFLLLNVSAADAFTALLSSPLLLYNATTQLWLSPELDVHTPTTQSVLTYIQASATFFCVNYSLLMLSVVAVSRYEIVVNGRQWSYRQVWRRCCVCLLASSVLVIIGFCSFGAFAVSPGKNKTQRHNNSSCTR